MSQSLVINYTAEALPDDPWWLTTEVMGGDDRATIEDVATIVDALYELNPCIETDAVQEEEPDQMDLFRAAQAVDLELCKLLRSGDYEAEVRVIRSHPRVPYKIIVDVGEIRQTVKVEEERTLTIDVQNVSELLLPYPVISGLRASWLGTVYGSNGVVVPPAISALHNTLFWSTSVSGTIRVQYRTTYDLVTVAVPGLLTFPEDQVGDPQSVNLLIFYHYQSYVDTIDPPPADPTIDDAFMAQICGWGTGSILELLEEEEEPLAEPPLVEDPCVDHFDTMGSYRPTTPDYYQDTCCRPWPFAFPQSECEAWIVGHKPGKGLDQAIMNSYLASHDGPVEFIGIGNPGPEGCGEIIHRIEIRQKSCCVGADPIAQSIDNPGSVDKGVSTSICVTGGKFPLTWTIGGGYFPEYINQQTVTIDSDCIDIVAAGCEVVVITVTDGCTTARMSIQVNGHDPLYFETLDRVVAPGGTILVMPLGGVPPFTGWVSDKLIHQGNGYFLAPAGFCGQATVTVMDQCMAQVSCIVRSTSGYWQQVFGYDLCEVIEQVTERVDSGVLDCSIGGGLSTWVYNGLGEKFLVLTRVSWCVNPDDGCSCTPTSPSGLHCAKNMSLDGRNLIQLAIDGGGCSGLSLACGDLAFITVGDYLAFPWQYIYEKWEWVCA